MEDEKKPAEFRIKVSTILWCCGLSIVAFAMLYVVISALMQGLLMR